MFSLIMYLLAGATIIWMAVVGLGALLLPVYLWMRIRGD